MMVRYWLMGRNQKKRNQLGENVNRSPGVIPITYLQKTIDGFGDEWLETKEIGYVHTSDILELLNGMDKIWVDIRK